MAVKNTLVTSANPLSHPQTAAQISGQRVKKIRSVVSIANGDSIGSIYLLGMVPDSATVIAVTLEGATTSGLTDCDIGLFDAQGNAKLTGTGFADFYADGLNLSSSTGLPTGDFGNPVWRAGSRAESGGVPTQEVWQDAGDAVGPYPAAGSTIKGDKYQIGLTLNAAATAAGTYVATIEYQAVG
ncbi:MAG: hypothetical protein KGI50_06025 [Patescibacteria group bacterium]|nr:hypothetical protein [Patescibacteria group bacterium]